MQLRNSLFVDNEILSLNGDPLYFRNFDVQSIGQIFQNVFDNAESIRPAIQLTSSYNQTGTAGSADIRITRSESGLGSGTHSFISLDLGSDPVFRIDRSGEITAPGITGVNNSIFTINGKAVASENAISLNTTQSPASGQSYGVYLNSVHAGTSTSAATDFTVNRTGTNGSGEQLLFDFKVNSTSQAKLSTAGKLTLPIISPPTDWYKNY